ncbi:Asp-tRNA(Asn)/Glu-tRNA(Gln) amidotransferase subunit GatC [Leucobacter sp. NPDC077196]|uniref:Asp-tRNA(Asn)/Glu-tRNA(Gln) amidotransferase subunit GatC n=1 Tax=Leucobacter sp. NPDC077196 TaxID=3154959 RepID=UPI0034308A0D
MPETSAASTEITADTVAHLAGLARIALTPDEVEALTSDLDSILTHIAKVGEVTTPDVPATSHPLPLNNVTRPDVVSDVLTQEEALANAPETTDGMFRVSSILGEEQ